MRIAPTLANGVLEFVMDPRIKDRTYQQPTEVSTGMSLDEAINHINTVFCYLFNINCNIDFKYQPFAIVLSTLKVSNNVTTKVEFYGIGANKQTRGHPKHQGHHKYFADLWLLGCEMGVRGFYMGLPYLHSLSEI